MEKVSPDISVVFYTANVIPEPFAHSMRKNLLFAINGLPLISVSKKPMDFGENIVVDLPRSHLNIYRQALIGAKKAQTKYIAMAEDDVLYTKEHFDYRSSEGKFAYNLAAWNLFTWSHPPVFNHKSPVRRNLFSLVCERDLFIEAMEERFAKYPDDSKVDLSIWAEPAKYERQLGVTVRESEEFYSDPPLIVFIHETGLAYNNLGERKKMGQYKAYDIPYWGAAEQIRKFYVV